jgi:hypothetical protein
VRDMAYDRYSRLHHPRIHDCHRQQDFSLPQDLSAKLRTQRKMHERHKRYKIVECSFHATTTIDSLVGIENPEEELTEAILGNTPHLPMRCTVKFLRSEKNLCCVNS